MIFIHKREGLLVEGQLPAYQMVWTGGSQANKFELVLPHRYIPANRQTDKQTRLKTLRSHKLHMLVVNIAGW